MAVVGCLVLSTLLTNAGQSQTLKSVASFSGKGSAAQPQFVTPSQGRDGKLYGTTFGAAGSYGSVFQLATAGALAFPHVFDSTNGSQPSGGVTLGTDGNLYGVATHGGAANDGVLYRLSATGAYTVLHEFGGGSDGADPVNAPVQGSDGGLYGITTGSPTPSATLYKYTASGSFETIYTFNESSFEYPTSLIEAENGNLYGTTNNGGVNFCGTIFEITKSGSLVWSYTFPCGAGGAAPMQILQASDGNFYGPTYQGGGFLNFGTIFKLTQEGAVSIIYTFPSELQYAAGPVGLVQATDGNLYGVTAAGGGRFFDGTLFKLTLSGAFTPLFDFNGENGNGPLAPPTQKTDGTIYGTTEAGGKFNSGEVYGLNVGLGPFVTFVQPTGKAGTSAQILGQGLTGTTSVTFNGIPATSFKVASDTFLTAVVPSGATTGKVVVTTPGGALTSNVNFRITQ
jgi:uncharacterized repeat protein (TIGR03803 family)